MVYTVQPKTITLLHYEYKALAAPLFTGTVVGCALRHFLAAKSTASTPYEATAQPTDSFHIVLRHCGLEHKR